MNFQRFLLKFYYIGSNKYYGSQRQNNLLTIENCLLKVLKQKKYIETIDDAKLEMASRTDRYVSARGSCFSFNTKKEPILMEINTALPREIGVWAYAKVSNEFSARFNSIQRHYKYIVSYPLSYLKKMFNINLKVMKWACKQLQGFHDFQNFCKFENDEIKTQRHMDKVTLSIRDGFLIFDFISKAFLRQQIRRTVQKILELGKSESNYNDFLNLFDSRKRVSYRPVDPTGLILWDVKYEKDIDFHVDLKSQNRMYSYFSLSKQKYEHKSQLFRILEQNNLS